MSYWPIIRRLMILTDVVRFVQGGVIDENEDTIIRVLNVVIQRLAGPSWSSFSLILSIDTIGVVNSHVPGPTESDGRSSDVREDE